MRPTTPLIQEFEELYETQLPTKRIVCPRCEGEGTHTNPAIDGNGLTAEDFYEDEDFAADYMNGKYDVLCETCRGANVVVDVLIFNIDEELRHKWFQFCDADQGAY